MSERQLKSVCVFCGSREGNKAEYVEGARKLGEELARRGMRLVYGGGNVGLMGEGARGVLENGGEVLGVVPYGLVATEISGESRAPTVVVLDMHTRKAMMSKEADAFIALPGGYGTLEELFEVITWAQLG